MHLTLGKELCREYKSKEAAGQLDKSPYEFTGIGPSSPLVWLARGYAVLSGPSLPIIAEGDEEPNDSYVQQLVGTLLSYPLSELINAILTMTKSDPVVFSLVQSECSQIEF